MSRACYHDEIDDYWCWIRWRGAVKAALRGARGQAFLREMIGALDALPEPRLIGHELVHEGEVCAIGSVGVARGIDMEALDPEDYDAVAAAFGIAPAMVREIEYENDEGHYVSETPEQRFQRMRAWAEGWLR